MESDEDYIPISARVDFRLSAVKEAEELPEYIALKESVKDLIQAQQKSLKAAIIACAKIERGVLQTTLNRHFCESIHAVTSLFHLVQQKSDDSVGNTVYKLMEKYADTLLKHSPQDNGQFMVLYLETIDVADQPEVDIDAAHGVAIKRAIESVFVLSWDRYLAQVKENELALSLKKRAKTALQERKTEDATMLIDDELPTDRVQLDELIRKQALIMAQSQIKKEIASQLRQAAKIPKRGQGNGASQKKKSDKAQSTSSRDGNNRKESNSTKGRGTKNRGESRSKKPPAKEKKATVIADDSASDSESGKKNKQRNRSKKQSNKQRGGTRQRRKQS